MTLQTLQNSKVYLFLLPSSISTREKIVGCVVAQRISSAMAIAPKMEYPQPRAATTDATLAECGSAEEPDVPLPLVAVDASTGIFCLPDPLPTPLGIPRVFVAKSHRRLGIASTLLSAVVKTFVPGCVLDPLKGEVAFSQPTGDGNALMKSWGHGGVRIYEEY
jgi:N-acetyltransferase